MGKRVFLFLLTNIAVMITVSILVNLLGLESYISANGINYQTLLGFCLLWGMVGSLISLSMSKFIAKMSMGLEIVDENSPYRDYVNMVHMHARSAGITKMPEVAVYNSPEVNAFATGPSKNNSLVALSTGLMDQMSRDEVEGVIAHEVAHIANGDMVTMALVQGVVNAFVMFFARIVTFAIDNALRSNDDEGGQGGGLGFFSYFLVYNFCYMVFAFMAMPIVAWFSRYREYRADEGGAHLAGRGKMIGALENLKRNMDSIGESAKQEPSNMAAFKISNRPSWMELFSTHPPLEKRIERLKLAY